jgi:hypothetical protein
VELKRCRRFFLPIEFKPLSSSGFFALAMEPLMQRRFGALLMNADTCALAPA